MVEEKKETNKLSKKKKKAGNVSEQRDKCWIHVIRVHDTTHLAVTTTRSDAHELPHTKKD